MANVASTVVNIVMTTVLLTDDVLCWLQTLKAEFTQQESMLKDLEVDAEKFREEKKFEAAERLEQQLSLLKVTRFQPFTCLIVLLIWINLDAHCIVNLLSESAQLYSGWMVTLLSCKHQ